MLGRFIFPGVALLALCGFSVEGPRGGAPTAILNLLEAPRWADGSASLIASGERGLGGGIEYAVDDSICRLDFIDGADCAAVHGAIADSAAHWASGHPAIGFVDVTGRIEPAFPLAAFPGQGQGAEIDFFAATAREFPPFLASQITGYTIFYERPGTPYRLTNGQVARGQSPIESADIRLNAERCYYLDPAFARPDCLHFHSVIMHEIGHALGIAHPEERLEANLDSDDDPTNEIVINCEAPDEGLLASGAIDGASVALGRDVQGPGRWQRGLTWDDVAARDALYPHCGITRLERFSGAWGAFAVSETGLSGRAHGRASEASARNEAAAACRPEGCEVVASFQGCFAFAEGEGGRGHAMDMRSDIARIHAVLACNEAGGRDCRIRESFCAFDPT